MTPRQLLSTISGHSWTRDPLRRPDQPLGLGVATTNPEEYHAQRKSERRELVGALAHVVPMERCAICSIGSGYGGEEMLMTERGAQLVMIEPDERQAAFLRDKFGRGVIRSYFQFVDCSGALPKFDVVYASGLGCWMNADPLHGIDRDMLTFLKRNLKPEGLGVFLIYGGTHNRYILDKPGFLHALIATAGAAGFRVELFARYTQAGALLVIKRRTVHRLAAEPFKRFAPDVLIESGVIVKHGEVRASDYAAGFLMAGYTLAKNLGNSLRDFAESMAAVRRYR